jgi:hypothetical protein
LRHALAPLPGDEPAAGPAQLAALDQLQAVWTEHSAVTEQPGGMLAQIVTDCPRLAPAADRLRHEHATVSQALAAARAALDPGTSSPPGSGTAGQAAETDTGGTGASSLLRAVADAVDRHREAGRSLLYEAYQVDLGLGE